MDIKSKTQFITLLVYALIVISTIEFCITVYTIKVYMHDTQEKIFNKTLSLDKRVSNYISVVKKYINNNNKTRRIEKKKDKVEDKLAKLIGNLQPKLGLDSTKKIAAVILKTSKETNLDPLLITSLIYTESTFRPLANSKAGAVGLMQVRFSVWKDHSILKYNKVNSREKLFWIENNIKCGTTILKKYLDEAENNIVIALNRYHTGSRTINKKPYEIAYVNKIMLLYYNLIQKLGGCTK